MDRGESIITAIQGKAILAPMLATTDIPFRRICREYGAALTMTEMVSAVGILRSASDSYRNAVFSRDEHPIAIQIVASDPDNAAAAIRELAVLKPDVFDLNCGCPNERICEAGAGAELLDDLPRMGRIIAAAVRASSVPISVKMRTHGLRGRANVAEIARMTEDNGASWLTLHARARNTPYDVAANWSHIADAVSAVSIPVVGNGDVFSAADAFRLMENTGCAAVMVARGCLGTPWIFDDIRQGLRCDIHSNAPDAAALRPVVSRHLRMMLEEFGEIRALVRMRKHALWYARRFVDAESLRTAVFATQNADELARRVDAWFAASPHTLDPYSPETHERELAFRRRVLYWTSDAVQAEG